MAKKIIGYIKLQLPAAKATPQPPVGPALGAYGVAIPNFTKEFNERTKNDIGLIIPVVITVYADRSFTFITKTPPAPVLINRFRCPEQDEGRLHHEGAGASDRRDQDEGSERGFHRGCHEHDLRYGPFHGRYR